MSDEKKIINNEDFFLADFDAYRTGEEHDDFFISSTGSQVIEDLEQISKIFIEARPDAEDIPESVDNLILEHIKEKSREIRRSKKVVRLSPRYKWAAAAVMGVLVCIVSFNLVYKMDKPANKTFMDNATPVSAELSKDTDEKDTIAANKKQPAKIRLADGDSTKRKSGLRMVSTEMRVNNIPKENLKPISGQTGKDIDGNGKINIIDAYLMNRRLMSGTAMPKDLDLNGDGNIDREDVNMIVKTAVSLGRGEV